MSTARRQARLGRAEFLTKKKPADGAAAGVAGTTERGHARLDVRLDHASSRELGPGHVSIYGVTCEIAPAVLDADGGLYLCVNLAERRAEFVLDEDGLVWDLPDWGGLEPVFVGFIRGGELSVHNVVRVDPGAARAGQPESRVPTRARRLRDVLVKNPEVKASSTDETDDPSTSPAPLPERDQRL